MKHNQLVMYIISSKCLTCNNAWTHSEAWLAGASPEGITTFGLKPNSLQKKQLPLTHLCLSNEVHQNCFRCINPTLPNLWTLRPRLPPEPAPEGSEPPNALRELEQKLGLTND